MTPLVEQKDGSGDLRAVFGSRALVVGIVEGLVGEQRTGDEEQPIGDGAQRPAMAAAAASQLVVTATRGGIVLHGHARPMVDRLLEPPVAGSPTSDEVHLAAALCHRSDPGQSPQNPIVSRS